MDLMVKSVHSQTTEAHSETTIAHVVEDSFDSLNLTFTEITEDEFSNYIEAYTETTALHCTFSKLGLREDTKCDEICETYLTELSSGKNMTLPCDYDVGILGVSFSPSCTKLIVCSSYDGPEYHEYYNYRAEFYLYNVNGNNGLESLLPAYGFGSKEWSIADYVWITDHELGLKVYSGNGFEPEYQFVKASIPTE